MTPLFPCIDYHYFNYFSFAKSLSTGFEGGVSKDCIQKYLYIGNELNFIMCYANLYESKYIGNKILFCHDIDFVK